MHTSAHMWSCFVGILCGTIAGKKKKKMMYLTAKNAGEKTVHAVGSYLTSLIGH